MHNPRYAGAFAFGRFRSRKLPDGRTKREHVQQEDWLAFIPDAHPGYISWEQYERIRELLCLATIKTPGEKIVDARQSASRRSYCSASDAWHPGRACPTRR